MAIDYDKYIYSTGTHYIANSGSNENKGYHGGKPGDQTGREAELKAWYNRPWTVVLRYPDQAVALKIAQNSIAMCLNPKVGYDQDQRNTYWQELKKAGYDPSKIPVACEEDCTAGVSANVKAAGHTFGIKALENLPLCSSRNMRQEFVKAGFIALTSSKYLSSPKYLLPGDILLYENHHAACNITVGSAEKDDWFPEDYATQHKPEEPKPEVEGPKVKITGSSVFVRKGPSTDYGSLGVVHAGDVLRYFDYDWPDNGWHLVEYQGQTGWVSGKYGQVET
jgi:hypothetical protein